MSKMQPAQNRVDPYGPAEPFCDDSTSVGVPKFKSQPVSARSAARAILVMLSGAGSYTVAHSQFIKAGARDTSG